MSQAPLKAASDAAVRGLLDRYRCPVPFHAVRTRFLGEIASLRMSVLSLDTVKALWGGALPEFDSPLTSRVPGLPDYVTSLNEQGKLRLRVVA